MPVKPTVDIRPHNGRPTVHIDGVPHPLPGFNPQGMRERFREALPYFARHGMGVYIVHQAVEPFWVGDRVRDEPDADLDPFPVDESARLALEADPDAWIWVRFTPHPPQSWKDLFPQESSLTEDNSPAQASPSLASERFWEVMARVSAAIVRYCESRPWADRLIGYCNFHVVEGTHVPVDQHWLFDHNPLMVRRFRQHLRQTYGSDQALRAAWGDGAVTLDTAPVPRDRLRGSVPEVSDLPFFQAGADNAPLRDYLELQGQLWHQRFRQVAAAMLGAVDRKVLFVYDCLKQTQQGWNLYAFFWPGASWRLAFPETMAGSGHIGVADLFDAPGCDGLMTPLDYQARGVGGVTQTEGIADSLVLRGKYYFGEMDQRTWPRGDAEYGTPRDLREFAAITWRNFADAWTRGYNAYLFDIGGGYYSRPEFHDTLGRQVACIKASVDWRHQTVPGIAMVLDDRSVLDTSGAGNYHNEAVMWEQKLGLARCGVPYRVYLLEDLLRDDFPDHRLIYFPNLFRADDERLALVRDRVCRDGRVVLWGPGSGISDGERLGPESAQRLTGFRCRMVAVNCQRRVLVTNFDHPATKGAPAGTILGGPLAYGPVLFPEDGERLGMALTKWECNEAGLAVKEYGAGAAGAGGRAARGQGDWAAVFTAAVPIPAGLWRSLARWAGAHVYCEEDEVVMADASVVALQSTRSGPRRLALPRRCRVRDLVADRDLGVRDAVEFEAQAPETRVFLLSA